MTLHRHALSALVLFPVGALLASGDAKAGVNVFWKFNAPDVTGSSLMKGHEAVVVIDNDPTNTVASVELSVSSDSGDEDLVLTESDAWLHGSAAISALPAKDAALTLTLYDKGSASLMTFSGTLAADGTVTLEAPSAETTCDKSGCTSIEAGDVEILSAEVFPSGKGYALTLDLSGADTYEVAYAMVAVSGGEKAEMDWDAVGSVWMAEATLEHTGVIDVKAKALDAKGNTVENVKVELGEPWVDGGGGVNTLTPSMSKGLQPPRLGMLCGSKTVRVGSRVDCYGLPAIAIVSDGWTTTSYPTHAQLDLAGGDTVTVPANSFLRRMHVQESIDALMDAELTAELELINANPIYVSESTITISGGNFVLKDRSLSDLTSPICSNGTCALLVEGEKGYELAVTSYGTNPAKLPSKQDLAVVIYDKFGTKVASETLSVAFDPEVTAVFASELDIEGDPMGGDASGSVSLLGAADKKGKQATLSKGSFYGSFSRDSDGDFALGGYGTDDSATSDTSAGVLLGDPVECGGEGCDGDWAPPVIVFHSAGVGGKVTKIVVSSGGLEYNNF